MSRALQRAAPDMPFHAGYLAASADPALTAENWTHCQQKCPYPIGSQQCLAWQEGVAEWAMDQARKSAPRR